MRLIRQAIYCLGVVLADMSVGCGWLDEDTGPEPARHCGCAKQVALVLVRLERYSPLSQVIDW
jgi:hypothetical protein